MNENKSISIKSLISSRDFLAKIISEAKNEYEKAGEIQAFEVSYELAKNTLRKILLIRGIIEVITPKEIFRLSALEGLIKDSEVWFGFTRKRNLTSHTYDGEIAKEIILILPEYLKELNILIKNLENISECYK